MKSKNFIAAMMLAGILVILTIGFYFFLARPETNMSSFQIIFLFVLFAIVVVLWSMTKRYTLKILGKYRDVEKLLLDIRDGTRTFYKEKRRAKRIDTEIRAKIIGKDGDESIKILNISATGALLKINKKLAHEENVELNIYLPLFPQPIDVKAKVVRCFENAYEKPEKKSLSFSVGVEFLTMSRLDKERLIETIDFLLNQSGQG